MGFVRCVGCLVLLTACEFGFQTETMPSSEEVVFSDADGRVVVRLGPADGFPDPAGEYRVVFEPALGTSHPFLTGFAQRNHVANRTRASLLASGDLAVALNDTLCVIERTRTPTSHCADLREGVTPAPLQAALRWRAHDPDASTTVRAYAAFALATHVPEAGIEALSNIEGSPTSPTLAAQIRGTLARLRPDRGEIAALGRELPNAPNAFAIGLARACIESLEPAIRRELANRSTPLRSIVEADLAQCHERRGGSRSRRAVWSPPGSAR